MRLCPEPQTGRTEWGTTVTCVSILLADLILATVTLVSYFMNAIMVASVPSLFKCY